MTPGLATAADVLRLVGVASMVVAIVAFDGIAVALFALVLLGLLLPRFLALPAAQDVTSAVVLLVAAWSAVLGLYEALAWWDLVVHTVCTAVLALLAVALLDRAAPVPQVPGGAGTGTGTAPGTARRRVALAALRTGVIGLGLGVLWEAGEWAGHTHLDPQIHIGYADTLSDLAAGGAGSAVAGALVAWRREVPPAISRAEFDRRGSHSRRAGEAGGFSSPRPRTRFQPDIDNGRRTQR